MMDHLSCLGPIDPQIEREGKLVPALSYLNQFERLNEKAQNGQLSTAEYELLNKLNLGELYQFEQIRELPIDLLIKWLTQYKFKNWKTTETSAEEVTGIMKIERAREIASLLNDPEKWHSHGRAIDAKTLREEVNLKIDSFEDGVELYKAVRNYFELLGDYMHQRELLLSLLSGMSRLVLNLIWAVLPLPEHQLGDLMKKRKQHHEDHQHIPPRLRQRFEHQRARRRGVRRRDREFREILPDDGHPRICGR